MLPGPESILVQSDHHFFFKVVEDLTNSSAGADQRISFRKECDPGAPSACPESESFNECSTLEWWCEAQTLTCMSAHAWTPNGEESTCKTEDVYVSLQTRTKQGSSTVADTELFKIENVETRCCRGECRPPNPPVVPEHVAQPEGMASSCFWYDESKGWVRVDEDWVYFATLNVKEGCEVKDFAPYLKYESNVFEPDDWSHCAAEENCFKPPEM